MLASFPGVGYADLPLRGSWESERGKEYSKALQTSGEPLYQRVMQGNYEHNADNSADGNGDSNGNSNAGTQAAVAQGATTGTTAHGVTGSSNLLAARSASNTRRITARRNLITAKQDLPAKNFTGAEIYAAAHQFSQEMFKSLKPLTKSDLNLYSFLIQSAIEKEERGRKNNSNPRRTQSSSSNRGLKQIADSVTQKYQKIQRRIQKHLQRLDQHNAKDCNGTSSGSHSGRMHSCDSFHSERTQQFSSEKFLESILGPQYHAWEPEREWEIQETLHMPREEVIEKLMHIRREVQREMQREAQREIQREAERQEEGAQERGDGASSKVEDWKIEGLHLRVRRVLINSIRSARLEPMETLHLRVRRVLKNKLQDWNRWRDCI
jgi:hypothetical protein